MSRRGGLIGRKADDVIEKFLKKADVKTPKGHGNAPGGTPGPSGPPGTAPKPKAPMPPWLRERLEAGNRFNTDNHHRYPHNEVTLANGKRLDSYVPGESIVSRKNTQLSDVNESTARGYINEIDAKYSPGTRVLDTPHNEGIGGTTLNGDPVLEVPVQHGPIPQSILEHARNKGVTIVDVDGRVYT